MLFFRRGCIVKVLLTGASSSPGFKTLIELASKGYTVYAQYNIHPIELHHASATIVQLDLTQYDRVVEVFNSIKPDIVVHMAALGNVDQCEADRELAWKVNVEATRLLAKLASKHDAVMLYLSTDYVFDGERGMYREEDKPNPINFYGHTKLIAEEIVKSLVEKYIIVRTSAIYGFGMGRTNFGKFLVEALSRGQHVQAIIDQRLSPTLNTLLAKAIVELLEKDVYGVFHIAGERVSRYDFAVKLAQRFGFDVKLIEPAKMADFKWVAKRPRDSSLDCSRARSILSTNFNSLDYSLDVLYSEWVAMKRS